MPSTQKPGIRCSVVSRSKPSCGGVTEQSEQISQGLDEELLILERLVESNHERLMQEWLLVEDAVEEKNDSWFGKTNTSDAAWCIDKTLKFSTPT